MNNEKSLRELNEETLQKLDAYLQTKGTVQQEHHEKINAAKDKWQQAWLNFWKHCWYLKNWKYNLQLHLFYNSILNTQYCF